MAPPPAVTLAPQTHRFFYQLATAQAATVAYVVAATARLGHDIAEPLRGSISQVCFTRREEIKFSPTEVLDPIAKKFVWPSEIHLTFQLSSGPPAATPNLSSVQLLMGSLYEHAFMAYYSKIEEDIGKRYGYTKQWPDVLNFGRVVRNAFAHGGTLDIRDDISYRWGGISYSKAENGRRLIYNDLSAGDLTLLMLEMDVALGPQNLQALP